MELFCQICQKWRPLMIRKEVTTLGHVECFDPVTGQCGLMGQTQEWTITSYVCGACNWTLSPHDLTVQSPEPRYRQEDA